MVFGAAGEMDLDTHPNGGAKANNNLHDILIDPTIPDWKKDLIVRKRNTNRLLFGNLKFTCAPLSISNHNTPTADAIRNDDIAAAAAAAATTDAISTEEQQLLLVGCLAAVDGRARISSPSAQPERENDQQEVEDEEVHQGEVEEEEEEEDFHPQEEDSPQVNGESDVVGRSPGEDEDAVDSLSVSAPERVSPECRTWCEGAMRLNNDTEPRFPAANTKIVVKRAVNGAGKVKRAVLATSNKIMGEEKPKMKTGVRKLSAPPTGTKTVVHTVNLGDPEEIKYGPGIVHKLRDRYINITLRESASAYKQRPPLSNLRRASSLDNILDEAPVVRRPPQPAEKKQPAMVKEPTLSKAENMKRHRSMETLLFEKQAPLVNDDIVIIEHSQPAAPPVSRKRNSSGGGGAPSEDEMPPPDVVKQTRQKFERRTNTLPQPKHGIVATRVANYKKPALSPKPANIDALRMRSKDVGTAPLSPPMSPPEVAKVLSPVEKKLPPVIVSEEPKVVEKLSPPAPAPRVQTPKEPPPVLKESPPPPKKELPPVVVTPKTESPPPKRESPQPPRVPSPKESTPPAKIVADDDDETTKIISKKALENIRKNGFSFVISPKGSPNLSHLPGGEKGSPPQVISVHQKVQDKQVGVIRPIPKVVSEKNLINAVKSEQPLIKAVTLRPVKVEATPAPAPVVVVAAKPEPSTELWGSNKRHFNEQPSTQLFDFTTRKSVPDYIENDGLGQRPAVSTRIINFFYFRKFYLNESYESCRGNG
jgi:hypothetical protein